VLEAGSQQARRFFVARQQLAPPRSASGVMDVVRRMGSLQYDPIDVAGRSHDLVLHARVRGYAPGQTEQLYPHELFEAYNKGISFVPLEDLPWFRHTLTRKPQRLLDGHADVAARVLERIRAEGPLASADFEVERTAVDDWFNLPMNAVRTVLESLAVTGVLGLARREGARRYYDLVERLVPAQLLAEEVPVVEQLRHRMLSRHRAHGLLAQSSGNDVYTGLGAAKYDERWPESPGRRALHDSLVDAGELVPVQIEGVRTKRFVLAAEVPLLESPPEPTPAVALLSPFDPLVWERPLVPPKKRRWGWYVLPILFGDRLVGRCEPRIDREAGAVQMLNVWWEPGFLPAKAEGFAEAMNEALAAYLRFAKADRLDWPAALSAEKRLFPMRG
jgi:hypothetical protein